MSKIALFAFALAAVLVTGFQHANAAQRHSNTYGTHAGSFGSDVEAARFDPAKGYAQGY